MNQGNKLVVIVAALLFVAGWAYIGCMLMEKL